VREAVYSAAAPSKILSDVVPGLASRWRIARLAGISMKRQSANEMTKVSDSATTMRSDTVSAL
jgi:hypothetical protein